MSSTWPAPSWVTCSSGKVHEPTVSILIVTGTGTGVGKTVKGTKKIKSPVNPTGSKKNPPKGNTTRIFITKNGANTLRAVAKIVYGNAARWKEIYNKNTQVLKSLNVPLTDLQYKRLPYGMKLHY